MKKIFYTIVIASTFAACNGNRDLDTRKDIVVTDTSGMYRSNVMTDTGSVIQREAIRPSSNAYASPQRSYVANNSGAVAHSNSRSRSYGRSTASTSNRSYGTTATTTRRRGWSHAAKNAVIGGVGGAVAGAIIDKKHGQGALIGGVVGAAGGYILGRSKDKREGR